MRTGVGLYLQAPWTINTHVALGATPRRNTSSQTAQHHILDTLRGPVKTALIVPNNGEAAIFPTGTVKGLANYPRGRLAPAAVHRTLYISGTSSRRPDGTFSGAGTVSNSPPGSYDVETPSEGSTLRLDVREQTAAILRNIDDVIKQVTNNRGGLENIIDATVYLVDMKRDYAAMNEV
ncbi:2-aminomuconate deaminase [Colletotrichum spaethianum]|uniref:2-aminomuconate deaminase n=1 Tax=Colletotrichum spaethianum TaxID=700344 RepID=A0AA37P435_9PEZI|nr:2-aminomuconate deaminase [Colletotrichum spaethianum]GKT40176.1 2-aminomuconate deaminase [Colletotrichum spaethianum]